MSKIIAWSCAAVVVLAMVAASFSTHANTSITTETVQSLEDSIYDTVEALMEDQLFTIDNSNQFIAAFLQGLMQKVESDSEIRVEVLEKDEEYGLLSIRVIESFRQPSGKESTVSCDCTVIFDRKAEEVPDPELIPVTFYYSEEAQMEDGMYKEFQVKKGSTMTLPQAPLSFVEGAVFQGWKNTATGEIQTGEVPVDGEMIFHGIWTYP